MLQFALPRHLRPRREKIFGPAPAHRLDGNAKARLWAAAAAYGVLVVAFYGYVVAGLWLTITFLGLAWVLPALIGLCAGPLALCCLCARFRFPPDEARKTPHFSNSGPAP